MAGGIGTRFWPLSTKETPKQFLHILGKRSMIQQTVDRVLPLAEYRDIYIVTNESQIGLVREHLPELPEENIIAEPMGRNTAACIGLSAVLLQDKYEKDETMLVLPADHYIGKPELFREIISQADAFVKERKKLLTFGIQPTYPATGYGYIEFGQEIQKDPLSIFAVKQFKEKPDAETAEQFVKSGTFAWNSGMFLWRIDSIIDAIKDYMPSLFLSLNEIKNSWNSDMAQVGEIYSELKSVPVDIGIMEKADNAVVVPINIDWNDIGSWEALDEMKEKDKDGNCFEVPVMNIESHNSYVYSDNPQKRIALIDVDDVIVVETKDALLVCRKEKSQDVKKIVERISEEKLK
jgi:mannose-1-phosphate guanylyltransferase